MKNIHVIVATGEWGQDRLRYRRHRLAEFLRALPETKEVIWLCPAPNQSEESLTALPNGIKQWTVRDLFPHNVFRFGRYMDRFYKKKIQAFLKGLKDSHTPYNWNLWYTFPGFPLLADLFPWDKVIYDCSDLWASPISGAKSPLSAVRQNIISAAEKRIIQRADFIFCTSDHLRDQVINKLAGGRSDHVHTIENGVEFDLFARKKAQKENVIPDGFNGTVLGFIGGIKPKLDLALIRKAAQHKRNWLFLFVGPDGTNGHEDFKKLLNEKNVLWTGSVNPFEVPEYMNVIDIGIMPYKPSPYNQAVFPLKLFEFLAAGKAVVGMHLPSTSKYAEESVYAHLESDHYEDFIAACEKLELNKSDKGLEQKRKELAKTRNWEDLFKRMMELVQTGKENRTQKQVL
ncbi:teichuronic acid biosynthesis protein TuaH [Peribacillus glennii]|uniref:Glycosyltransferase family 1 protein n=1 Tax=Peribacillus glennii TaxID=2303991 RepID=A0A372LE03_9BACI|nr:glycosyltransferase [Peribacillus glennii]RFU63983.1 glycosyltransferase family 1 protein [Peribacillus glennii]